MRIVPIFEALLVISGTLLGLMITSPAFSVGSSPKSSAPSSYDALDTLPAERTTRASDPALLVSAPAIQRIFNVSFAINPSRCLIQFGLSTYGNGRYDSDANPGFISIQAVPCSGEAFVEWTSTAGTVNRTGADPAEFDVESNGTLTAHFAAGYTVTFNETGLPLSTTWTMTLNNNSETSISATSNFNAFQVVNGTYSYRIARIYEYSAKYRGKVAVDGANLTIPVPFSFLAHTVTFQQKGLPADTWWSVTFNGTRTPRTSEDIEFGELNGTYAFSIGTVVGYTANTTSGTVKVSGSDQIIYVEFAQNATKPSGIPYWEKVAVVGGVAGALVIGGLVYSLVYLRRPKKVP